MKIRQTFVSNSSSSSFIIGYGVIKDQAKLLSFLGKNKIKLDWDIRIHPQYKIFTKSEYENEQVLRGGNNTAIEIPASLNDKGDLFIVEVLNDEGDYIFWNENFGIMEYEKAKKISFFSDQQQKLIRLFKNKKIITDGFVVFGAERNG